MLIWKEEIEQSMLENGIFLCRKSKNSTTKNSSSHYNNKVAEYKVNICQFMFYIPAINKWNFN